MSLFVSHECGSARFCFAAQRTFYMERTSGRFSVHVFSRAFVVAFSGFEGRIQKWRKISCHLLSLMTHDLYIFSVTSLRNSEKNITLQKYRIMSYGTKIPRSSGFWSWLQATRKKGRKRDNNECKVENHSTFPDTARVAFIVNCADFWPFGRANSRKKYYAVMWNSYKSLVKPFL